MFVCVVIDVHISAYFRSMLLSYPFLPHILVLTAGIQTIHLVLASAPYIITTSSSLLPRSCTGPLRMKICHLLWGCVVHPYARPINCTLTFRKSTRTALKYEWLYSFHLCWSIYPDLSAGTATSIFLCELHSIWFHVLIMSRLIIILYYSTL